MSQTQESSLKKASTHLGRILLILTIIGATAFWISYFYTPIEIKQGDYSIQTAEYPGIDTIELDYLANFASVDIRYDAPESMLFNASWTYIYSPRENVTPIDLNISATQSPTPNVLCITVEDTSATVPEMGNMWKMSFFFVEIHLNPMYQAILDINSETASFSISATDVTFSAFDIETTTGSVDMYFNNVSIPNSLSVQTTTGSIGLYTSYSHLTNIEITQTTGSFDGVMSEGEIEKVTNIGTTGSIDLVLNNIATFNSSFENLTESMWYFERTTGSIDLVLNNASFYDLQIVDGTGSVDLKLQESTIHGDIDIIVTTGSIDLDLLNLHFNQTLSINAEASTGSINIDWTAETYLPYEVNIDLVTSTGSINVDIKTLTGNFDKFQVNASSATGEPDIEIEEL